ncbi:DedA family protein [Prauserella oleivorans]
MFELLHDLTAVLQSQLDSPWLWLVVFVVAGLDALLPFMPSETTVITVAVLLGPDVGGLALLTVVAAVGALAGDCFGHGIARGAGPRTLTRLQRTERGRRRYAWAREQLDRHGAVLVIAGRYVPGGRVASALATGSLRYPSAGSWHSTPSAPPCGRSTRC